ncbi:acylphosphatase [Bradyrhizobium cytisi]|uniref:acylphosphatase n=1 Tax=Bradyrhizobium cytisi TaxID=515489 RepID=A0A5S4XAM8_9BRAD|nr:acylphosphatase [Bradyrhizobium cytisi]TYL86495.1 acylphosphatase [Bradyrhizobium cytisi]
MSRAILQVMIRGHVQGVGYRAWVESQAVTCGLEGWVRNRRDGSVEALFAGTPMHVADMVALCRHGPPSSRVDSVTSETASVDGLDLRRAGETFSVLPTV